MKRKLLTALLIIISYAIVTAQEPLPPYLRSYKELYRKDPHQAALKWFDDARFGLFIHWGASTFYKKGEWNMFYNKIPIALYKEQAMKFTGEKFSADSMVNLAKAAHMKYITYVVQHHDGFAMYNSKATDFTSMKAAAHRDYLKELSIACNREGLGLFIYYSLGINWTHPFYLTKKYYNEARPAYSTPQSEIRFQDKSDFVYYWNSVKAQIYELCTNYGSVAGFWFDPIGGAYTNPDLFEVEDIYKMIRRLQPQSLISYKTGFNGNEDFISCEHEVKSLNSLMKSVQGNKTAEMASLAWEKNKAKKAELTTTMQNSLWGYYDKATHKSADEVMQLLQKAADNNANLLLNIGPYPDGSIVPADKNALIEVGKQLKLKGFPTLNKKDYMKLREEKKTITERDLETIK
ncbi:alpha-L-fucosidase [Pedobacter nutrimenti]|uniref:alpha-L-fucosidase n=1 Tax=Pedobacter nutrimenti TaxID=1241337 RepID=UPI00292CF975|nr:alpha-L-fucosidase [Pedobacter nutrimenti]